MAEEQKVLHSTDEQNGAVESTNHALSADTQHRSLLAKFPADRCVNRIVISEPLGGWLCYACCWA